MPLYDYDCAACGRRLEVVHGVHAPGPTSCANCGGGPLRKAIVAPAIHFKGSGWAKRDRRATVASGASRSTDDAASSDGAKSDGAKSDGASDAAAEQPAATPSSKTTGAGKTTVAGTVTKTD